MKTFLSFCLLICSVSLVAQEDAPVKKHEFNANVFNAIIFKSPEFSYEYLIDAESSVGSSVMFNLNDLDQSNDNYLEGPYYEEKFALTAFYRRYFSSKYAWGFFIETFGMYNKQETEIYNYNDLNYNSYDYETSNNFAVGISVGGKWVSSKGFVFQIHGGVGRNLISSNDDVNTEIVPRLGASFGIRF